MGLVELDVTTSGDGSTEPSDAKGANAWNNSGYILYFSDRRGNRNGAGNETGEFGFEDVANPADAANGVPNNTLEAGEDFNGNGTLETYGGNLPVSPVHGISHEHRSLRHARQRSIHDIVGGDCERDQSGEWRQYKRSFDLRLDGSGIFRRRQRSDNVHRDHWRLPSPELAVEPIGPWRVAHSNGAAVNVGQSTTLMARQPSGRSKLVCRPAAPAPVAR